jgi:hypothetical protein
MNDRPYATVSAILAILSAAALAAEPVAANAQATAGGYDQNPAPPPSDQYPQGAPPQNPGPPPQGANAAPAQGQYAPAPQGQYPADPQGQFGQLQSAPPPYAQPPGGAQAYNYRVYRQAYRDWQIRYAQWATQYCVNQHARNTAAGALIGGSFGALLAAGIAAPYAAGAWALFGGALGATTGAAVGASAGSSYCPGGYVVRVGAPGLYYYGGPAYGPGPVYGSPWGWSGGRGYYRPYGYGRPVYRAPGYPAGPHPYY